MSIAAAQTEVKETVGEGKVPSSGTSRVRITRRRRWLVRRLDRYARRARGVFSSLAGIAMDVGIRPYRQESSRTPQYWDDLYREGRLDRYGDLSERSRFSVLLGYLDMLSGHVAILEIGCGVGLLRARMRGIAFRKYVGTDISAEAILRARQAGAPSTTYYVGEFPPEDEGLFDIVVCNEMLYYVDRPDQFLAAVAARLRPGGHLLLSIYHHRGEVALHRVVDQRFERIDAVELVNKHLTRRRLRHLVSCHRLPTDTARAGVIQL